MALRFTFLVRSTVYWVWEILLHWYKNCWLLAPIFVIMAEPGVQTQRTRIKRPKELAKGLASFGCPDETAITSPSVSFTIEIESSLSWNWNWMNDDIMIDEWLIWCMILTTESIRVIPNRITRWSWHCESFTRQHGSILIWDRYC